MKYIILIFLIGLSSQALADTEDSGKITNIYVTSTGLIAFKINGGRQGIPNAVNSYNCSTGGGWVGYDSSADPVVKSAILTAKASNMDVVVSIDGCHNGWFKVRALQLN